MRTFYFIPLAFVLQINNGLIFAQQRKLDSLYRVLDSLGKKTPSLDVDTNKVLVLSEISNYLNNFRIDGDKALSYGRQALELAEKNKWNRGKVESYFSLARIYEDKAKDSLAIDAYNKIIAIARMRKVRSWEANSLHRMGELYFDQGNYPIALDHFLRSLKINEELKRNLYIANNLVFLGHLYTRIGDYPNALRNYEQSLKRYQEEKNKYWVAINLQSIATVYSNQREYSKAIEYHSRILDMLKGNKYSVYMTYIDMGNVYRHQLFYSLASQPDTAWLRSFDYYSKALATANELDDKYTAGVALNGLGWLYLKRSNIKEADIALTKAKLLLEKEGTPDLVMDCYLNISQLDSMKGNWKRSLEYYKLYAAMQDSLFDRKKSRDMANLEVKYVADKKQEEIAILNKDNELKALRIEQQQKNILLIIAVAVILLLGAGGFIYYRNKKIKQEALKQISEAKLASLKSLMDKHFIFSSLHSIDTFLMNNDSEAASDYLVKYSKLIRSILEMSNQAEVSLDEEITLCKSYLDLEKIRLEASFDYEFSIDGTISLQETLFPSMLLQPLVENAVKHGVGSLREEGRQGFIHIDIKQEKDKLICSVTDNGKGLQFSGNTSKSHRSYSGKGIIERVRVYNTLRKNRASFLLKDNNPGVTAVLTLPYLLQKQSVAV